MRRILVIGGLAAGPAAAAAAARRDPRAEVILVEAGPHVAWGVCELPHFLAGEISDAGALVPFSPERFERERGARVLVHHRAVTIDRHGRRVVLRDARGRETELAFDALVLATGSRPRLPRTGSARALKTVADAVALREQAARLPGGRAAVLGAGYVGLETASALAALGLTCTVFDREPMPLAGFEEAARRLAGEALAGRGIDFRGSTEIETGNVVGADLVVSALGVDPEVDLARAAGIERGASGAIRVDERGETSAVSVFAAGDCAEVRNRVSGERGSVALATVAVRTGCVAGANAAGGAERFAGAVSALGFRFAGLEVGRAGLSLDDARRAGLEALVTDEVGRSRAAGLSGSAPLLVTLVVERGCGRLLGANVVGAEGAALRLNLLAAGIARGSTVAEVAGLELAYAPSFSTLRDPLLVAAARAERDRLG